MTDAGPPPDPVLCDLEPADLETGIKRQKASEGTFPLAAMIFGWPPATDTYTSAEPDSSPEQPAEQQEQPGAWLQHFASKHADADVWRGLLLSCKAGRGWALQYARAARMTLDCTFRQPELRRTAPSLRARGKARTTLVIKCAAHMFSPDGSMSHSMTIRTHACLAALPEQLAGCGGGITELRIETAPLTLDVSSFLHSAAPHLPNLTTLHSQASSYPLPPPSLFPALTYLAMEGWLCSSVAAYTTHQLSSLQCTHKQRLPGWHALFDPARTAHRLTSFQTSLSLTAELLGLLLKHAPQLQRLGVSEIKECVAQSDAYRQREWDVQQLTVSCTSLSDVAALPRCAAGQLVISGEEILIWVKDIEGLLAIVIQRCDEWLIQTDRVSVYFGWQIPETDQPATLRTTLQQLSRLHAAAGTSLQLTRWELESEYKFEWEWTAELAAVMAALLPGLPQFRVSVQVSTYSDRELRAALAMGPCVHELSSSTWYEERIEGVGLGETGVSWRELSVGCLCLSALTDLVTPSPIKPLLIKARGVYIGAKNYHCDKELLSHVRWAPRNKHPSYERPILVKMLDDNCDFSKEMGLLQAMQMASADTLVDVNMVIRRMDQEIVAALQCLPDWVGCLKLEKCEWPLEPAAYVQLGRAIPPKCRELRAREACAPLEVLRCIGIGANERRKGLSAELLLVESGLKEHVDEPEWVGDHVVLCSAFWHNYDWYRDV